MKILIADFDLFAKVGGGQTFYRSIIEKNADLEFHYFTLNERRDAPRPANARPIAFREQYACAQWDGFGDALPPRWSLHAFVCANNIAASVAGRQFDVVDVPDYEPFALFLRPALTRHEVRVGRVALSLHGRISTSIHLNWATEGQCHRDVITLEDMQYRAVDLRYGLSQSYLDEWNEQFNLPNYYLCPMRFIDPPSPLRTSARPGRPDLNFVGRTEKRKGPDLVVDLAWWLPRESYGRVRIIGPESWDPNGTGSNAHLKEMLRSRLNEGVVELAPPMSARQLRELFASRSITILPSRYDTFLLAATESLFSGCPTAIGNGAGVCRFLEDSLPGVPFVKIDVDRPFACLPQLEAILSDYDCYRDRLVDSLQDARPAVDGPTLAEIYNKLPAFDTAARAELCEWYERLIRFDVTPPSAPVPAPPRRLGWKSQAKRVARAVTTPAVRRRLRACDPRKSFRNARAAIARRLRQSSLREDIGAAQILIGVEHLADRYRTLHHMPERTEADLDRKIGLCANLLSELRLDRIRLWREMGRLEHLRGHALVAATYRLRAIRLAGADLFHDLPLVVGALNAHGYWREADVVDAMYGAGEASIERCSEILDRDFHTNRQLATQHYEFVDDRRDRSSYKASVIVSLYGAASKLPQFLEALRVQTLVRRRDAEIVLVDSGSPDCEYRVFQDFVDTNEIPIVYARSTERETIQAAWNRGIALSRGEYLSFLGVDEALLPQALERLSAQLDADASLDWVQANSLVTNVNERGHWLNDIMVYDRSGYEQPLVYLESCYLAFVGSLYRRTIHDRFGYYDRGFRGAGDTEFKNRVLPFIKTKVIPETLGIFWNYPSGQTTCSPLAELEDIRAWYLHRSPAGIARAWHNRDCAEAESLLFAALRYRKSYCQHWSTDVEYAHHLAAFLERRDPASRAAGLISGIRRLLGAYRSIDALPRIGPDTLRESLLGARRVADEIAIEHKHICAERVDPAYRVFNDNRYEQHNQIWRAAA